jgi:Flp pilus assembly protein TadG
MKSPAVARCRPDKSRGAGPHDPEHGITMILVAISMVAIIAMAALSIDVVTLYLAREEAQRSADAAALAAARVLSVSGITGDSTPTHTVSWADVCGTTGTATQTAQATGLQNGIGNIAPSTVAVTYAAGGISSSDCSTLPAAFTVNPMVTVQVTRPRLPTFFSRIWGNTGNNVSASATAEAFNPSDSGNVGNGSTGTITPVEPRCVKPWVVPNHDPVHPPPNSNGTYCDDQDNITHTTTQCDPWVVPATGAIRHPGISTGGSGTSGVIGEHIWLVPDCSYGHSTCVLRDAPPQANFNTSSRSSPHIHQPNPTLEFVPGLVGTPSTASPHNCSGRGSSYENAITGCDQSTHYQCGIQGQNTVDLSENPAGSGDTMNGVQCLIREGDPTDAQPDGQDTLSPYGQPSTYPFQILAGSSHPLTGLRGNPISGSNSIVSLPIYDDTTVLSGSGQTSVTFVGFLQVFINGVDQYGNIDLTILNVAGCGNGTGTVGSPALGSSPVPVRLITPP